MAVPVGEGVNLEVGEMLRHLTSEERLALRDMFDAVGAKEIIGVLAGLVANNVPDLNTATALRASLSSIGIKCAKALGEKDGERV